MSAAADYVRGWYQVAFESALSGPLTPLAFGGRSLMAVGAAGGEVRIYDAVCPHRGAHLAYGGRVAGEVVICPFHGHHVGLGRESGEGFCVREYACLVAAGGVFVRLSNDGDADLPAALAALGEGHLVVPGFEMTAETSMEVVIENGFDSAHFRSVHGLACSPLLAVRRGGHGDLEVEGVFEIPSRGADGRPSSQVTRARYLGRAFSPGIFVAELAGEPPFRYRIMTTATPNGPGPGCTIRLTLILPAGTEERFSRELLEYSRDGLERDRAVWNHLQPGHTPRLTAQDAAVATFGEFCREFRQARPPVT